MTVLEILVSLADGIIESFGISYFTTIVLMFISKQSNSINKKNFFKFCLTVFVAYIINHTIHILLPDLKWLKSLVFIAAVTIGGSLFYKTKYYKSLISSIALLVASAIIELLMAIILKSFKLELSTITSSVYYNSIFASAVALLETLIAFFAYSFNKNLNGINNKLRYFIPQLVAVIICLFPTMVLLMFNYFEYSVLFIIINLIQLLVVALVGIYNLNLVAKHENTELKLANTIVYNETLSKVNEGVRGFKHDMGNIVQSILGYIALNDSEGAKKYCQNLVIGFNDINVLSILSPKVINDPAIYGVVVNKILLAREKNLTLSLDVNLDVANINFPKFDLSRILGILLDNAIEASEQTDNKKLTLNMRHDFDKNKDIIEIANSVKDTNIDTIKIFEKEFSTKKEPSGFGLYEVNKFLKHNPQAYLVTTVDKEKQLFTQILTIFSE